MAAKTSPRHPHPPSSSPFLHGRWSSFPVISLSLFFGFPIAVVFYFAWFLTVLEEKEKKEMAGDPANARQGRKIVVAVDEGEESMYALSWCLDNVAGAGDTLLLLHAMPPRVVYTAMDGTGYLFSSDIIATMEKHGRQVADAVIEKARGACSRVPFPINVEAKVEKGDPRDVICETVEKLGADVLVLGSHGYGLIKRAFLGSVSNHCAQNVKCPVLIVKRPKQH